MRPAADLEAEGVAVGDFDKPDALAVAVAEKRQRAAPKRLLVRILAFEDARVLAYLLVHQMLNLPQLIVRHRLDVREVEAQPVGGYQRTGLADVSAENLP